MKTRTELETSLKTLTERRENLARLVADGKAHDYDLLLTDQASSQVTSELAAVDQAEAAKASQPRQDGRRGAAKSEVDYAASASTWKTCANSAKPGWRRWPPLARICSWMATTRRSAPSRRRWPRRPPTLIA